MAETKEITRYLPLSEATFYILLALAETRHGYAVMQWVEQVSGGVVMIGPGTLYGAFSTLEKEKLIAMVSEKERRKCYALTAKGRQVLRAQIGRLEGMLHAAQQSAGLTD